MILKYQAYHDNTDDQSASGKQITELHRPIPGINCRHTILSKIQVSSWLNGNAMFYETFNEKK